MYSLKTTPSPPSSPPSASSSAFTTTKIDKPSLPPTTPRRKSIVVSDEVIINSIVTGSIVSSGSYPTSYKQSSSDQINGNRPSYSSIKINPHTKEIFVEPSLAEGTPLLKVSAKKKKQKIFRIDVGQGLNIENIKELRVGEAIRSYREQFKLSVDYESRWFTIVYIDSGKYKTLHLVAPTPKLFNTWVDNLEKLYLHRKDLMGGLGHLRKRQSVWLKQHWKQANKDGDSKLGFDEVVRLCRQLNINMSKASLRKQFDVTNDNRNDWLDFSDFKRFVKIIKRRTELEELFTRLATARESVLTLIEFKNFLIDYQKCNLKELEYENLYLKFCNKNTKEMTLEGFSSFMMSSDNPTFSSEHAKIYQDMDQPLSHYFVDSSHNTYLLGHQLTGESSVEGYIRVLQRGCRCVEIDCWDGPDGPVVTHGRTWTSKILFQDVISVIRTYAFKASPYPLILSLEVHCCIEQQGQMAFILNNLLGESLVTKFLYDDETTLPSPKSLMHKILLKGKNLPSDAPDDFFGDSTTDTESATDNESDVEPSKNDKKPKDKPKKEKTRVSKALSDLIIYCSATKFRGFEYHRENSSYYHMSSFSEKVSTRLLKSEKLAFIRHNTKHLSRIYPAGFRINSSNYEPHHQWIVGSQLVALNWQTFDLGMQINQAMFAVNGRCGYVLKSDRLRNPDLCSSSDQPKPRTLSIEIISAQQLPKPKEATKGEIIDPFVEVTLLVPNSEAVIKKTKTISDNGFNPIWKEKLSFTIECEEIGLVFLRFCVLDEDVRTNDFIAYYCTPLTSLQMGRM
ncbi:3560_t:CDS:10 [Entrophospora sp. SA101]|nr:3560_t:CDS:10 [Entrophospora sp. SA101]